jgi:nucleoside-diphosphate-sugar epimerase
MNIIVLGGGGYLGIPLLQSLQEKHSASNITVFDDFSYDSKSLVPSNINIIDDKLHNIDNYEKILSEMDVIYYLASPRMSQVQLTSHVVKHFYYFEKTLNLLSKYNNTIYFTSSCSVYGKASNIVDEASATQHTSSYSTLKILCENKLLSYKKENYKILRLSTVYGYSPIYRQDNFINYLIKYSIISKNIDIFEEKSIRPYIFIDDCIDILTMLPTIKFKESIVNVGNDQLNISKEVLLKKVENIFELNFNKQIINSNDERSYEVDFSLLKKYIDFNYTDYETGLTSLREKLHGF